MKFYSGLLILLITINLACGKNHRIEYEASYMGIPLLDMTLTWLEDDTSIHVTYDNKLKPFIAFFHPIHNIYEVRFSRHSFSPISWSKRVSEGDLKFSMRADRSLDGASVKYSSGHDYVFPTMGYTVFSATHYLAQNAQNENFFPRKMTIFIDGELWEATAQRFDVTKPHPEHKVDPGHVLVQTNLHYLSGQSLVKKNDILTSVIATEGTQFMLWVSPDGSYKKAQFGTFPKAVILDRVK